MNLLNKFFKKSEKVKNTELPVISLLFENLPNLNVLKIEKNISEIERLNKKVRVISEKDLNNNQNLISVIEFDNHKINLVGFSAPIPQEVIEKTVKMSFWKQEQKEKAIKHNSHIICYYQGNNIDPIEQYIALYKLAYAFLNDGLIGLVNENAWTFNPEFILEEFSSSEKLIKMRNNIPLFLWTSLIKVPVDNGVWFVTKGNNIFGVKEFAYFGNSLNETEKVRYLFDNLFYYIFDSKANIQPGHTMQIEDNYFKFSQVNEYHEYLESTMGTLVLEKQN